jgi:hypothetical protein
VCVCVFVFVFVFVFVCVCVCVFVCLFVCLFVFRHLPHTARHNRGTRTRQPPDTLDPTHESGRHSGLQRSVGVDRKVANSHQNGSNQHPHSAGQDRTKSHRPATDEVVGPAIGWYSCQDGVFSQVCCCRALLWCRFRTRKGLFDQNHDIRYPKGMPTDECGETTPPPLCRSPWCEILYFSIPFLPPLPACLPTELLNRVVSATTLVGVNVTNLRRNSDALDKTKLS